MRHIVLLTALAENQDENETVHQVAGISIQRSSITALEESGTSTSQTYACLILYGDTHIC